MKFYNKVALVTGGTSGIGYSVAERLMKEGAKVVIVGRNVEKGEKAIQKLKEIHSDVMYLSVDISNSNDVKKMVRKTVSSFGKLDVAFNNAGNAEGKPALTHEYSEDDFDKMMGVTIKGVWLCLKYEIQEMLKTGGGAIVNTSSLDALICSAGTTAYAAGKSGVIALTRAVAQEYGTYGIRVNALTPGAIRTPMIESKFQDLTIEQAKLLEDKYSNFNAAGRIGKPEEAAAAVIWLLSDEASYITGQNIIVDGGVSFIN
ncbi:SDR family NAD(P)-dependent oxidoreductase [Oceanobacillus manasiensis]|uniref:SDR family NAD(P)-dependent oxidoreductase n=1 Tax=Oceanobacillus manasiensis TaxID=586413 RepID=UPI0005A9C53C|nr:glucose 1-dehydrogenase [Oceanobacillus manasiensis]